MVNLDLSDIIRIYDAAESKIVDLHSLILNAFVIQNSLLIHVYFHFFISETASL